MNNRQASYVQQIDINQCNFLVDSYFPGSTLSDNEPDYVLDTEIWEHPKCEPFLDHAKKAKDGRPGVSLDWFNMLYQVLLGQEKGPRFGSFVAVYGLANSVAMIDGALARSAA